MMTRIKEYQFPLAVHYVQETYDGEYYKEYKGVHYHVCTCMVLGIVAISIIIIRRLKLCI